MIEEQKGFLQGLIDGPLIMRAALNASETSLINLEKTGLLNEEPFDLVVFGTFFNDFFIGVAAHFKSPLVIIDTHRPTILTDSVVGNPSEVLYVPTGMSADRQPLTFLGRVRNVLAHIAGSIFIKIYVRNMDGVYRHHFPEDKYPSLRDVYKNVSLILYPSHFSEGIIRPEVPTLIQIGGIQAKPKPDPLPKHLASILDGAAEHGVIFFSLGSNAKSSDRDPERMRKIFNVFSTLKQKVIWKWESGDYPGNASNIFYGAWLPQDDILAHPNLRLFVSHCGLGSVVESKFHGVPVLAIPLFGDQFSSAKAMVDEGFAVQVSYKDLTEESLRNAIKEVLGNPSYRERIQAFSKLYRDRPMAIRDLAAYWLEYVIRHRGAKHMQSPAVHMCAFQYYGLDVMAFLLAILFVLFKILSFCCRKVFCICKRQKQQKTKDE
ncbi:unnamed protein product [Hermetia illucens]|uniref:UDP-glucuronosyltransferase n=1 Tax=Hermetia illucens TaxID=343691 RepID=A0A7R8UV48_HERIL|nr:unnamed protein product [Hermetia illucens]